MHSPRRSVRPSEAAETPRLSPSSARSPKRERIQDGKSPPTMSPSRVKRAQRAMSAASKRAARIGRGEAAEGLLHVEQADIVLAALADDDAVPPLVGIGHQPRGFLVELALQVLGIGRDPHRRIVAPRPEPGGRQIAQRLAEARAGLGQQDVVHVLALARREGEGGGGGIVLLRRARLGFEPQDLAEKGLRLVRARRPRGGRADGRRPPPIPRCDPRH